MSTTNSRNSSRELPDEPGLDIAACSITNGSPLDLISYPKEEIVTRYEFCLPEENGPFRTGQYKFTFKGYPVEVLIAEVESEQDDPLLRAAKSSPPLSGTTAELGNLPYEAYTDHRGEYPYTLAKVVILNHYPECLNVTENGLPNIDYERSQITGVELHEDKVLFLQILQYLFKNLIYCGTQSKIIRYEQVSYFNEIVFHKNKSVGISIIHAFTAPSAYQDAYKYHILGNQNSEFDDSIQALETKSISDEASLQSVILDVIDNVIRHWIEDRRLTEPFWDAKRVHNNTTVPTSPKTETNIQPTLLVLLDEALKHFGVHVYREPHVGAGELDYACCYTLPNNQRISIPVEFKLAHHSRFFDGLSKQLPQYMKSLRTTHGVFLALWFKDPKGEFFSLPKHHNFDGFTDELAKISKQVNSNNQLNISYRLIDASLRPTASY